MQRTYLHLESCYPSCSLVHFRYALCYCVSGVRIHTKSFWLKYKYNPKGWPSKLGWKRCYQHHVGSGYCSCCSCSSRDFSLSYTRQFLIKLCSKSAGFWNFTLGIKLAAAAGVVAASSHKKSRFYFQFIAASSEKLFLIVFSWEGGWWWLLVMVLWCCICCCLCSNCCFSCFLLADRFARSDFHGGGEHMYCCLHCCCCFMLLLLKFVWEVVLQFYIKCPTS